ncbi:MAG: phosphatidylglycerophosphatase A [Gammaproteobacteria bacterium]|nr:phosphatidylglycerophosphatase A [Gammaproteobacteria bacterium]
MNDISRDELVKKVARDPVHWLAFGFGSGLLPGAPGTWGSLVAVLLFLVIPPLPPLALLLICVPLFVVGIWICGESAKRIGVHDHGGIVWDEIVGMLLVLAFVLPEPLWIAAAFGLFRLFDIWKPWPIRQLDHSLSGGLGIMLDDALAAGYAALILIVLQRFMPGI